MIQTENERILKETQKVVTQVNQEGKFVDKFVVNLVKIVRFIKRASSLLHPYFYVSGKILYASSIGIRQARNKPFNFAFRKQQSLYEKVTDFPVA